MWLGRCAKVLIIHYTRGPGLSHFIFARPPHPSSERSSRRAWLRIRRTQSRYAPPRLLPLEFCRVVQFHLLLMDGIGGDAVDGLDEAFG